MLLFFFTFSAIVGIASSQDVDATTDSVVARFQGASGSMRFHGTTLAENFVMIRQSKIQEFTAQDRKVGPNQLNLAGQNSWTPLNCTDSICSTTFEKKDGDVTFSLSAHLARSTSDTTDNVMCNNCANDSPGMCQSETTGMCVDPTESVCPENYTMCTQTVTVPKDSLKFSISLTGWDFADDSNVLKYTILLRYNNGGSSIDNSTSNSTRLDIGDDFIMDMPTTALILGGEVEEEVDISIAIDSTQSGSTEINFVFPSFDDGESLYYDPTLGALDVGAASQVSLSPVSVCLALVATLASSVWA